MKRTIRAGMGLGDSLYLQSIVRHFVERGENVEVCSAWPDVFRPLWGKVQIIGFRRNGINTLAHYTARKGTPGTSQFEDMCISARVAASIDLRLDWTPVNRAILAGLARPIICVQLPRNPMDRKDGFGAELLPDCRVIQRTIDLLQGRGSVVQIGKGQPLYTFSGLTRDLANKTSVADLLDIASLADGFLGYCSFLVPLAESFMSPALFVWSRRGLDSRNAFINTVKPDKILHRRDTSRYVIDDCGGQELAGAVDEFLQQVSGRLAA